MDNHNPSYEKSEEDDLMARPPLLPSSFYLLDVSDMWAIVFCGRLHHISLKGRARYVGDKAEINDQASIWLTRKVQGGGASASLGLA